MHLIAKCLARNRGPLFASLFVFVVYLIHGAFLGPSDDEAYYWVLAHRPNWGFAYHPPGVAWVIWMSKQVLDPLFTNYQNIVLRMPAAVLAFLTLFISLVWLRSEFGRPNQFGDTLRFVAFFPGFFALAWLMVPDSLLFFGLVLTLVGLWRVVERQDAGLPVWMLGMGLAVANWAKFSGILISCSSVLVVLLWVSRLSAPLRTRSMLAIGIGTGIGLFPALIWNFQHEWTAILYQFRNRHQGEWSLVRWSRMWLSQLVLAGPILLGYSIGVLGRFSVSGLVRTSLTSFEKYLGCFALPPAVVFLFQPLWGEFKLHWAFPVWYPLTLALYSRYLTERNWGGRFQQAYGVVFCLVVFVLCHFPMGSYWIHLTKPEANATDYRVDVTNDFYGWSALPDVLKKHGWNRENRIAILGSRYQTAAQAAFALGRAKWVAITATGIQDREEWDRHVVGFRPDGTLRVVGPTIFVADSRYRQGPPPGIGVCKYLERVFTRRYSLPVKWMDLWICLPN